jgi:hypothetical protein
MRCQKNVSRYFSASCEAFIIKPTMASGIAGEAGASRRALAMELLCGA